MYLVSSQLVRFFITVYFNVPGLLSIRTITFKQNDLDIRHIDSSSKQWS